MGHHKIAERSFSILDSGCGIRICELWIEFRKIQSY